MRQLFSRLRCLPRYTAAIGLILNLGYFSMPAAAGSTLTKPTGKSPETQELIIKFEDTSIMAPTVRELFLSQPQATRSKELSYLIDLNTLFQLRSIERLFDQDPRSLSDVIKQFPERSARMPKHKKIPSLGYTYLFIFDEGPYTEEEMSEAYQKSAEIEYAHPNHTKFRLHDEDGK